MEKSLFEKLYRDYKKSLHLYIYSICRDLDMAEELMQETFVKAMLSLDDEHSNFKAWLFTVGKNLTLNKAKREQRITLTDELEHFIADDDILKELIDNEKYRKLYEAILSLPMKMRQIVTLHYFSGLNLKQIGKILDMSPGNVRIVAMRARQKIKKDLEETDEI